MSVYRCQVCKQYSRTQWRRVGLGSVCSEECAGKLQASQRGGPSRPADDAPPAPRTVVTIEKPSSAEPPSATRKSEDGAGPAPATGQGRTASTADAVTTDNGAAQSVICDDAGIKSATREEILERDKRCRYCGTRDGLDVHHIVYRSQGGGDEPTNLIALCRRHHGLVHSDKPRWQPALQLYIETFYGQGRRTFLLALDRQLATQGNST